MTLCPECGCDNTVDSKFCSACGSVIEIAQAQVPPVPPPPPVKDFGQEMDEFGKRLGKELGEMGKRIGKEAESAGKSYMNWWDGTLGMFAPVISGTIGVVVFIILLIITKMIATISDHRAFWEGLADFGWDYLLLFVGLIFLGSFQAYLHRRYRKQFRWVSPPVSAVAFVAWFWVFAKVLDIADRHLGHPRLGDLSSLVILMLPVIFVLVIIGGYLFAFVGAMNDEYVRR